MCDNTGGEPLAWMLRRGSAGSEYRRGPPRAADAAIAALPPGFRRKLMVTVRRRRGQPRALVTHLDKLAARRGYELIYSVGWALGEREKAALRLVPEQAWQIAHRSAAARSASAAPMAPARTPAARTGRAGSRKRTSPS